MNMFFPRGWRTAILVAGITVAAGADQQGGQRFGSSLGLGASGTFNAMGGAAVAARNDVSTGFWNPAGLSGLRGFQIEDQYTVLPFGQQLNYFALANGFRNVIFYGISFFYYSAGDIEARSGPSADPDSIFGESQMSFLVTLAVKLDTRWSLGGNLKVLTENFNNFSGFGFGEDMGFQYRVDKLTTLGFVVLDPITFMDFDNTVGDILPVTFKAGISHRDEHNIYKLNGDLEWSTDLGFRPRLGGEWRPTEILALRAGLWIGNLTGGASGGSLSLNPTAGIGILLPMGDSLMEFDYGLLMDRVQPGGLLHQVALVGKFL